MFTAITEPVYIAVIVAISSMFGPVLMAWVTYRVQRAQRLEDWARQDEVARRVEQVATHAAAAAQTTSDKLDVIHTLVNSNMTAALQSEFDAVTRELVMMKEVILLNRASGQEPSVDALAAITTTEAKIAELSSILTDRKTATDIASSHAQKEP